MLVYLNKYKNHWISPYTICEKICFWREIDYDEPWVKKANNILNPIMVRVQEVWDFFDRKIDYVHIDYWDVWSCDHTLGLIITPLLKHLRDAKCGYGFIDDEDAPEDIRSTAPGARDGVEEYNWDNFAEQRWNYVLNEMIWAFEQKTKDDDGDEFYDHSECDYSQPLLSQMGNLKVDREGLKKHEERKANGYRLFGKYYENLWT